MSRRVRTVVGYGHTTETEPGSGVWKDVIVERKLRGDVLRNSMKLANDGKVNNDLSVGNSLSLLADPYARQNFIFIKYVKWNGILWKVSTVEEEFPRLILRLGEVYNGPTPDPAPEAVDGTPGE